MCQCKCLMCRWLDFSQTYGGVQQRALAEENKIMSTGSERKQLRRLLLKALRLLERAERESVADRLQSPELRQLAKKLRTKEPENSSGEPEQNPRTPQSPEFQAVTHGV